MPDKFQGPNSVEFVFLDTCGSVSRGESPSEARLLSVSLYQRQDLPTCRSVELQSGGSQTSSPLYRRPLGLSCYSRKETVILSFCQAIGKVLLACRETRAPLPRHYVVSARLTCCPLVLCDSFCRCGSTILFWWGLPQFCKHKPAEQGKRRRRTASGRLCGMMFAGI